MLPEIFKTNLNLNQTQEILNELADIHDVGETGHTIYLTSKSLTKVPSNDQVTQKISNYLSTWAGWSTNLCYLPALTKQIVKFMRSEEGYQIDEERIRSAIEGLGGLLNVKGKSDESVPYIEEAINDLLTAMGVATLNKEMHEPKGLMNYMWQKAGSYLQHVSITSMVHHVAEKTILYFTPTENKIENQLKRIPILLDELNSFINDQDRLELLQKRMVEDFPKDFSENVIQFEKDMTRGVSFYRTDQFLQIEDTEPKPPIDIPNDQKVKTGASLLNELLTSENDKQWKYALQLVTNQTTINNIFDPIIGKFFADALDNRLVWDDTDGGSYALKAAFSNDQLPPIHLNIVRDPQSKEITHFNVEVKGFLDIVRYKTSIGTNTHVIASKAIEGILNYTVTLNDAGRPVISNLTSNVNTSYHS
ncbi:MAG: hypothetical protein H0V82_01270 [Candidatus Protochlamydia sp.]|nr:hypothetical protein [Candidatus Protochlamydia sp.]